MSKKEKYNYYEEFIKISNDIVESSKILNDTLKEYSVEKVNENVLKVHEIENDADGILHTIKRYLIKDFLPPINREDISLIVNMLDDIEDGIDEILINFNILNIDELNNRVYDFIEILMKCCLEVQDTMNNFRDFKKVDINTKVVELNRLEDEGDKIFENAMKELYSQGTDSINILRWTTIFNMFENTIDTCEHFANLIEDVILKNS